LCKGCSWASCQYGPPDPHKNLLIYLLQYSNWLKSVRKMTLFWHHPRLITVLLGHQSHIQSIFHEHQSECMNDTTKQILRHSNLEVSPFIYHPWYVNSLKICQNHAQLWFKFGKSCGGYSDPLLQTARKVWIIWYQRTQSRTQCIRQKLQYMSVQCWFQDGVW